MSGALLGFPGKIFSSVGGSSPGSDVPFYTGFTNNALTWSSLVWDDINNVLGLSDDIEFDISRVGSVWTFNQSGIYYLNLSVNAGALNALLGFRWQNGGSSILNFATWCPAAPNSPELTFQGLFPVNSNGEEFTLQYCRQVNAGGTFNTVTLDGENLATARISILRIGPIAA